MGLLQEKIVYTAAVGLLPDSSFFASMGNERRQHCPGAEIRLRKMTTGQVISFGCFGAKPE